MIRVGFQAINKGLRGGRWITLKHIEESFSCLQAFVLHIVSFLKSSDGRGQNVAMTQVCHSVLEMSSGYFKVSQTFLKDLTIEILVVNVWTISQKGKEGGLPCESTC